MDDPVVKIVDATRIPARGTFLAAVEVLNGSVVVGSHLLEENGSAAWEIVGLGFFPPPKNGEERIANIVLKPVDGQNSLTIGDVLRGKHAIAPSADAQT